MIQIHAHYDIRAIMISHTCDYINWNDYLSAGNVMTFLQAAIALSSQEASGTMFKVTLKTFKQKLNQLQVIVKH